MGLLLTVLLWAVPLRAQEDSRATFNEMAVQAMHEGDFEKAVRLFDSSLSLGELNMTLLNLGRALHKLGRCEEAYETYDRVETAPAVETPSPADVAKVLVTWRADLDATCTSAVVPSCETPQVTVSLNGGKARPCDGTPLRAPSGANTLVAKLGDQQRTEAFELSTAEPFPLEIDLSVEMSSTPDLPPPLSAEPDRTLRLAGWITTGVGAAALLTAFTLDLTVVASDLDDYRQAAKTDAARADTLRDPLESLQDVTLGLAVGGGVVLVAGVSMVLIDALGQGSDATAWAPILSPDFSGLSYTARW